MFSAGVGAIKKGECLKVFAVIVTFLKTGLTSVFELFGSSFTGFISMIYASPDGTAPKALTELGDLLLMGAVVGLAYMGIRFVRSMIPFVK